MATMAKTIPEETAEQYSMVLYNLITNCVMESSDRLVVGIPDSALSQHLQLDAELTLDKAKKQIHQWEAVEEQQQVLNEVGRLGNLEALLLHKVKETT